MQRLSTTLQLAGLLLMGLEVFVRAATLERIDARLRSRLEAMHRKKASLFKEFAGLLLDPDLWLHIFGTAILAAACLWIGIKYLNSERDLGLFESHVAFFLFFGGISAALYWFRITFAVFGFYLILLILDGARFCILSSARLLAKAPKQVMITIGFFFTLVGTILQMIA